MQFKLVIIWLLANLARKVFRKVHKNEMTFAFIGFSMTVSEFDVMKSTHFKVTGALTKIL